MADVDNRIKVARVAKPKCPDCDKELWLMQIKPSEPGYEMHFFECSGCMYEQQMKVEIPR